MSPQVCCRLHKVILNDDLLRLFAMFKYHIRVALERGCMKKPCCASSKMSRIQTCLNQDRKSVSSWSVFNTQTCGCSLEIMPWKDGLP